MDGRLDEVVLIEEGYAAAWPPRWIDLEASVTASRAAGQWLQAARRVVPTWTRPPPT
jgi:hypothetical protein